MLVEDMLLLILLLLHFDGENTIFIVYYIPDKFLYHFDELSSHTTVALAQPQSEIVYCIVCCQQGHELIRGSIMVPHMSS